MKNVGARVPTVLLNGRDVAMTMEVCHTLKAVGYHAVATESLRDFSKALQAYDPAVLLVNDVDIIELCPAATASNVPIIFVAVGESEARAIRALRQGAVDYFHWPEERGPLVDRIRQLVPAAPREVDELTESLVGASPSMQEV